MRAKRVDANQKEVVQELRDAGFSVETGHDDCLVGFAGVTLWIEIKNPKGRNRLQPSQEKLWEDWRGAYLICRSADEVMEWFSKNIVRR